MVVVLNTEGGGGGGGNSYRSSGHNTLTGGSNFSADGYSQTASTTRINARFIYITSVSTIIQLVNNEDERQKKYMSDMIRHQVTDYCEAQIEKLLRNANVSISRFRNLNEPRFRSSIIIAMKSNRQVWYKKSDNYKY